MYTKDALPLSHCAGNNSFLHFVFGKSKLQDWGSFLFFFFLIIVLIGATAFFINNEKRSDGNQAYGKCMANDLVSYLNKLYMCAFFFCLHIFIVCIYFVRWALRKNSL